LVDFKVSRIRLLNYVKIIAGPLTGILVYGWMHAYAGTSASANYVAMVGTWMAVWWIFESVPIELTGLLPMILLPFSGIHASDALGKACAPYADKSVYFFLGGFSLGAAIEKTDLHRRGSLILLNLAGTNGTLVVGAFMLSTALLSMWVSNTATTMLMLPLAMSVIATQNDRRFSTALLIGIAYAASIGGMGTLVGTAPNVFFSGYMQNEGMPVNFVRWMLMAIPLVILMVFACWVWLTQVLWPLRSVKIEIPSQWRSEVESQRSLSSHQRWTLGVFGTAAALWILREPAGIWTEGTPLGSIVKMVEDAWIAMLCMATLLVFPLTNPVLKWKDIDSMPWGVLLLLGGGLSLAKAIGDSRLDQSIASLATQLSWMPSWAVLTIVVVGVIFISELASNVATATAVIPILATAAPSLGLETTTLLMAAVLASSCGFMLPVATPPNTLVFAQRKFSSRDMIVAGAGVNLMAIVLIPLIVLWWKPMVFR
jgi:solute carrier family 13 (sodium-dependent dicarboxylate transporter), member 2/3/5